MATAQHGVDFSRIVEPSTVQVLVVDDFAPWRRFVRSMLQERDELRIVCEVSDGLEVLMDLALPRLNGMEAACRIRNLCINSKILFVSTNRDLDIIQEAFRSGIKGYVLKFAAQSQLLPAIEVVIHGERFLCPCLYPDDVIRPLQNEWLD